MSINKYRTNATSTIATTISLMITTFPDFSPMSSANILNIYPKPLFLVQGSNIRQAGFDNTPLLWTYEQQNEE
jgi:hypothetical protein